MTKDELEFKVETLIADLQKVTERIDDPIFKSLLKRWLEDMWHIQEELFFVENPELEKILNRKTNWD